MDFDKRKAILKLIFSNKNGVNFDSIIDYLDYVNKVRYSNNEVEAELLELEKNNVIKLVAGLWYPVESKSEND